jgi:hypothetical protein
MIGGKLPEPPKPEPEMKKRADMPEDDLGIEENAPK